MNYENAQVRFIKARITLLNKEGLPLEFIEGRITDGSIAVDGSSAVRRTCQISMISNSQSFTQYSWTLHSKFKVEICVNDEWFKQGEYLIASFTESLNNTGMMTYNISGKDKMCKLNGEFGGTINSPVNFDTIEDTDKTTNITKISKLPIHDIIKELVHAYGDEPFYNIIINDLDEMALQLQEYRFLTPMYIWRREETDTYENGTLDGSVKVFYMDDNNTIQEVELAKVDSSYFEDLSDLIEDSSGKLFGFNEEDIQYYIAKIDAGETCGYIETDLIYPQDLIANAGDSVVTILDKIKNFLGDFEYFYDIDGQFIFQKKKNYVNTSWTPTVEQDGDYYVEPLETQEIEVYRFENSETITQINYTPDITNVKNDYSVWGSRKGISGASIPIHMRYAIDQKPYQYHTINVSNEELIDYNKLHGFNLQGQEGELYESSDSLDWRELIYLMALDYRKYNHLGNFEARVAEANPDVFPTGKTGYEQYYIDMEGFWRDIYDPENTEWSNGWNPEVIESPQNLNFWIDFLDTSGELENFAVRKIGPRAKVVNEQSVRAIHYNETPNIIFGTPTKTPKTGYKYFNIGQYGNMFGISAQGKTAKNEIDNLLYKHGYFPESLAINALPVYHLEPNALIYIKDEKHGIDGRYLFTRFTLPLTYNGMMNITATKIAERLL